MSVSVDAAVSLSVSSGEALYLYALCPAGWRGSEHEGLRDAPVRVVQCTEAVWAVVDVVDREAWTGEVGDENLQSLAWVAPRATRHEEVVEAVMQEGPLYPARFATLFSSPAQLVSAVEEQAEALRTFFDETRHAEEWAVKLMLDRSAATAHLAAQSEAPATGTDYLRQKKREQDARASVEDWLDEEAGAIVDRLMPHAKDAVILEARDRPDDDREVATHLAFLISQSETADFFDALDVENDRLRGSGLQAEGTGPWPPYSFRPRFGREG